MGTGRGWGAKRTSQWYEIVGRMCVHGGALYHREHVCVMHGDIVCSGVCIYGIHGEAFCNGADAHAVHGDTLCSSVHASGIPEEILCSGFHSHVFFSMVHAHIVHGNTQCMQSVAWTPLAVECNLMWCTRSPFVVQGYLWELLWSVSHAGDIAAFPRRACLRCW